MSTVIEDVTDVDPSEHDEVLARIFNQVMRPSSSDTVVCAAKRVIQTARRGSSGIICNVVS